MLDKFVEQLFLLEADENNKSEQELGSIYHQTLDIHKDDMYDMLNLLSEELTDILNSVREISRKANEYKMPITSEHIDVYMIPALEKIVESEIFDGSIPSIKRVATEEIKNKE